MMGLQWTKHPGNFPKGTLRASVREAGLSVGACNTL
jgi:hypothetical protein